DRQIRFRVLERLCSYYFFLAALELQTTLTGGVCKGLHTAMIDIRPTVEDDFTNTCLGAALCDQLSDGSCCLCGRTIRDRRLDVLVERRSGGQGTAGRIVDDLSVDILVRTENRQTGTTEG